MGVSWVVENLSTLLPETTPQKSISFRIPVVGRLATNSPVLFMIPYECRCGRMAIEIIGGSELATPTQARVIMFGLAFSSWQVTKTTGFTKSALVGFKLFLGIFSSNASFFIFKWASNPIFPPCVLDWRTKRAFRLWRFLFLGVQLSFLNKSNLPFKR
jgi:hypothetical protein